MTVIKPSSKITYTIKGVLFIIQFKAPQTLNSMSGDDYLYLSHLLQISDSNPHTKFTVLQSSGRFFSSGADVSGIAELHKSSKKGSKTEQVAESNGELPKWLSLFVSRNLFVTHVFATHKKILVCCLNGPAVGLSAAIVMLCDLVYSMHDKVYLLFPFANLGLVTEGGLSVTLPMKLGFNVANEILMFSKPATFDQLKDKVITRNYAMRDVDEFNNKVVQDLTEMTTHLHKESITGMKKLLKATMINELKRANDDEVIDALDYWVQGIPQGKFEEIGAKKRKHKL